MSFLLYFLYCVLGYVCGIGIRKFFSIMHWWKTSCNIKKKWVTWRALGAIAIAIMSVYFQVPLLMLCVWFMAYESRARWCIVRSLQS